MEEKKEQEEKEIKKETHSNPKKKPSKWMYISVILAVLFAVSLYFNLSSGGVTGMSTAEAGDKIMEFINNNLMQPGMEAELQEITEKNGIYAVNLNVAGQEFTSYLTKDGEIFFPQGYVLADLEEELNGAGGEAEAAPVEIPKSDVPNLKMFVMSFCPYGQQAEQGIGPALETLGDSVELEPHFVIYSGYATRMGAEWNQFCWDEDETYCSMHGIGELNEDVRQLCIFKNNPDKWWDYVNAINAECSYQNIDECWTSVAEDVELDVSEIESCFDEKGELLLKKEVLLGKQYGVQGSPTIIINEAEYSGGRAPEDYKQALCSAFNEAPEECGEELSTAGGEAEGSC